MDELTLKFREVSDIRVIENCTDIEKLRGLTIQLVQLSRMQKQMMMHMMAASLPPRFGMKAPAANS